MSRAAYSRETPDVRRHALIEATAACLAELGTGGTSVRAICSRAGVSPGLVRHYFDGVDALIAETYRSICVKLATLLESEVAQAGPDPRARLLAYLHGSFRPIIADPDLLGTWSSFWGLARTDPTIAAIHHDTYAAFRTQLEDLLSENGVAPEDLRTTAIALTALVDGLWLELGLDPTTFGPEQARAMTTHWVDALVKRPLPR